MKIPDVKIGPLDLKIETDRSLVDTSCLRWRTRRWDRFVWLVGGWPRWCRVEREA